MPKDTKVEGIFPHSATFWTRTAEISTIQDDCLELSYFLKVSQGANGRDMVYGEYESMLALREIMPTLVPNLIGWGTYASNPEIYFFLCEFVDLTDDIPEISMFTKTLAELHRKALSPTGKYGFPIPTYKGPLPQYNEWTDSWEDFFSESMRLFMMAEARSQGTDSEMEELCEGILTKVIPRLLRPLETGGRMIVPRLIHGDIWAGNASTNVETNLPMVFNAACLYAHNESMAAKEKQLWIFPG